MKARRLSFLVMHVSTRCDQACQHCSIWKSNGKAHEELTGTARREILGEARALGARGVLFTGGEPLLSPDLEPLARHARDVGLSVQIATNGLGIARAATWLAELVDEIYVSLEGPVEVHDRIRGAGMFARLESSLVRMREFSRRPRMTGRSVVSEDTAPRMEETVESARALGLDAISFLPIDVTSSAFGGDPKSRLALWPSPEANEALRAAIRTMEVRGELGRFVVEDFTKLMAMSARFSEGAVSAAAPRCDAPEWSSVVEADGAVRPCFFQPGIARAGGSSLGAVRRSGAYADALRTLGRGDETCARCVCPKYAGTELSRVIERASRVLRPGVTARRRAPMSAQ